VARTEVERPAAGLRRAGPVIAGLRRSIGAATARLFLPALAAVMVGLVLLVAARHGASEAGQQLVNGLQQGAIYALVAVGYTMVYGIIELINFAHGDVFTLGAFYSILISELLGRTVHLDLGSLATSGLAGLVVALAILFPLTMLMSGVTGVVIERVAYRRLRDAPRLAPLITAIGVSFLLEGIMFAGFGSGNVQAGKGGWIHGTAFTIHGVFVGWKELFVIVVAAALMVLLHQFIHHSRLGKAMRATAQDRDAALICGININRTISATFFIGSALAGAGALIYALYYNLLQWNLGFNLGIIAFTAAVLGGIGNIVGAGLGGFLIGLVAVYGADLVGGQWSNSIVFSMLIIVLTFRPTGLLGVQVPDRA
jgi:branched-chain amino acid transport system permease protein